MANDSFTFLAIYMEDAGDMTAEEKGEYLEAVITYGLSGTESEHSSAAVRIAFRHAKKLIDAANAKKEAAHKSVSARWNKDDTESIRTSYEGDTESIRNDTEGIRDVYDTDTNRYETDTEAIRSDTKVKVKDKVKEESKSKRENISKTKSINNNISISNSLSPTSPSQGTGESERKSDFDLFWDAYPKKQSQSAALKAWTDAVEAGDIRYGDGAVIAEAVEAMKKTRQWQQDDGRFIPYPARYISERRWRDKPTEVPTDGSFKTDEFFDLAMKKSYEGMVGS